MKPISHEDIGKPITLTSEHGKGKLLTLLRDRISFEQADNANDQIWVLKDANSPGGGFYIVCPDGSVVGSTPSNEALVMTYSMNDRVPSTYKLWYFGRKGTIYQPRSKGGDRYLWTPNNELHIVLDGFLGERWLCANALQ